MEWQKQSHLRKSPEKEENPIPSFFFSKIIVHSSSIFSIYVTKENNDDCGGINVKENRENGYQGEEELRERKNNKAEKKKKAGLQTRNKEKEKKKIKKSSSL